MDEIEELTAYHESGHAVMAFLCGGLIERVSLEPPNDDGPKRYGETLTRWQGKSDLDAAISEIKVSLAGPISEMIYSGDHQRISSVPEWAVDWQHALSRTLSVFGAEKTPAQLALIQKELVDFFERDQIWAAVAGVADELLAHETIEHEMVQEVVQQWIR